MSLPPRGAAVYALLANTEAGIFPPGADVRDGGTIIDDYQIAILPGQTVSREKQRNFDSYQHWFVNYPDELITKVHEYFNGSNSNNISLGLGSYSKSVFKCPDNWKTSYNPGPPNYDAVPDPNGDTAELSSQIGQPTYITSILPRWHTDDAFDYSSEADNSYAFFSTHGIVPEKGKVYTFFPSGFSDMGHDFVGSCDIQVDNLLSKVLNIETNEYEYYPFTQATTELKVTGKYVITKKWNACCWNKGTIISGKVSIYSVDVTTGTIPESGNGFIGMTAEIGDTFSPHTEKDWSVTIEDEDDYDPVEIEIPKVPGKVTFVNDFWITEIVPPT